MGKRIIRKRLMSVMLSLAMIFTMLPADTMQAASGDGAGADVPMAIDMEGTNVAPEAIADAKYTNIWINTAGEVNDNTLAGEDGAKSWNSYGTDDYPMWVSLTWDSEYELTGMEVLWWADGGGVQFPKSCNVQYLKEGKTGASDEDWEEINDVGVAHDDNGINGNNTVWNQLIFPDKIKTTALRLMVERPDESADQTGIGISEWKVYGEQVPGGRTNVATKAVAAAEHANTPAASMNDGKLATSKAETSWNSWNAQSDPTWATLTWDTDYELTGMEVLWWADGGGVQFPHMLSICFLTEKTGKR